MKFTGCKYFWFNLPIFNVLAADRYSGLDGLFIQSNYDSENQDEEYTKRIGKKLLSDLKTAIKNFENLVEPAIKSYFETKRSIEEFKRIRSGYSNGEERNCDSRELRIPNSTNNNRKIFYTEAEVDVVQEIFEKALRDISCLKSIVVDLASKKWLESDNFHLNKFNNYTNGKKISLIQTILKYLNKLEEDSFIVNLAIYSQGEDLYKVYDYLLAFKDFIKRLEIYFIKKSSPQ